MVLFSIPKILTGNTEQIIANLNLESSTDDALTNHIQLLSQHHNSAKIWEHLLSSPSHFTTSLTDKSGYHFDPQIIMDQTQNNNSSVLLSEKPITSIDLQENDHLSIINPSLKQISDYQIDLDRLSVLGIQKHMCSQENYSSYMNSMFNILRLSDIRSDYGISEVVLRQSNKIVFDLNCIRKSDLPEQQHAGFCGFTMEEACRMMRYIGSVQQLDTLEICSIDFSQDTDSSYYEAISLLIWYMMEGATFRNDSDNSNQKKKYIVYPEGLDLPLYFYNESASDKWWVNTSEEMTDLIACSPLDYENARKGKYSDRLIKIMDVV